MRALLPYKGQEKLLSQMNSQMKKYIEPGPKCRNICPMEFGASRWMHSGSPTWKLSEPCPFGGLWRLCYVGVID